jgi:hypothetical protein
VKRSANKRLIAFGHGCRSKRIFGVSRTR